MKQSGLIKAQEKLLSYIKPFASFSLKMIYPCRFSHDRTMQDIVYKLVPGLQEGEFTRDAIIRKSGCNTLILLH